MSLYSPNPSFHTSQSSESHHLMALHKKSAPLSSETIHISSSQAQPDISVNNDAETKVQTISPFTGLMNAVGASLGVGILALPQAFQQGSLVVGVILSTFSFLTATISCQMFTEAASRYWYKHRGSYKLPDDRYVPSSILCRELPKKRYFGIPLSIIFQICNAVFLYANLLETSSTAAQSLVNDLPMHYLKKLHCDQPIDYPHLCNNAFWITLIVLTAVVAFISLFDLRRIALLFNIFSIWRWFVLFILVGLCSSQLYQHGIAEGISYTKTDMQGFAYLCPAVVFTFMWQASIGVVYEPIRNKEKTLTPVYFNCNLLMNFIYILVALLGQFAFGSSAESMLVYNFNQMEIKSYSVKVLRQFAVLFPPFVYVSSSPFSAQPLATQLLEWCPSSWRNKRINICIARIIACYIPALCAGGIRSFNIIEKITGVFAYSIMFIFPSIMLLASVDLRDKKSTYFKWWSSTISQWFMIIIGCFFECVTFAYF